MKKREFSKTLLVQESMLIWVTTLAFLALAFENSTGAASTAVLFGNASSVLFEYASNLQL